ncbi:MAG: hypothetical protein ACXV39_12240, partial [Halobacteriota archaeon]
NVAMLLAAKENAMMKYTITPAYINSPDPRSLLLVLALPPRRRYGSIPAPMTSLRIQRMITALKRSAAVLDGNNELDEVSSTLTIVAITVYCTLKRIHVAMRYRQRRPTLTVIIL